MMASADITVDPAVQGYAEAVINERPDIPQSILEETLTAAEQGAIEESGRTVCGDPQNDLPPSNREHMAVDLPGCRIGSATAIFHTHVTPDELRSPRHSIPDMANIVFGSADVSAVVGIDETHVMARPADDSIEAVEERFRNVVGANVGSPQEVAELVDSGQLVNLRNVRDRLLVELDPVSTVIETPLPDRESLEERFETYNSGGQEVEMGASAAQPIGCVARAHVETHGDRSVPVEPIATTEQDGYEYEYEYVARSSASERISTAAGSVVAAVDSTVGSETFRGIIVGQVVGTIVGGYVDRIVFND